MKDAAVVLVVLSAEQPRNVLVDVVQVSFTPLVLLMTVATVEQLTNSDTAVSVHLLDGVGINKAWRCLPVRHSEKGFELGCDECTVFEAFGVG